MEIFKDREAAGKLLAQKLLIYKSKANTVVIALPRGGVAVGFEISKALNLPLDILASRKIGVPGNEEFAAGAVTFDGQIFLNDDVLKSVGLKKSDLDSVIFAGKEEALRRMKVYRQGRGHLNLSNKTVILVDDGVATGATVIAAINSLRSMKVKHITLAIPVLPAEQLPNLKNLCDELIFIFAPKSFAAIGEFYEHFDQLSDEQVIDLMKMANVA